MDSHVITECILDNLGYTETYNGYRAKFVGPYIVYFTGWKYVQDRDVVMAQLIAYDGGERHLYYTTVPTNPAAAPRSFSWGDAFEIPPYAHVPSRKLNDAAYVRASLWRADKSMSDFLAKQYAL